MQSRKKVISVLPQYIESGIAKYGGEIDIHLTILIKSADLQYIPYKFKDGRILLVLPNNVGAFLYPSKEVLFETLNLAF